MVEVVLTYFKISGRLCGILARDIYPHCPADSVVNKRIINMLGFSQVLKPIQRQELLEERKKWLQCVSNRSTDSFWLKKYFGVQEDFPYC